MSVCSTWECVHGCMFCLVDCGQQNPQVCVYLIQCPVTVHPGVEVTLAQVWGCLHEHGLM